MFKVQVPYISDTVPSHLSLSCCYLTRTELDWARDPITEALSELQVLARLRDLVTRALSECRVLVRDLVTEGCQRSL